MSATLEQPADKAFSPYSNMLSWKMAQKRKVAVTIKLPNDSSIAERVKSAIENDLIPLSHFVEKVLVNYFSTSDKYNNGQITEGERVFLRSYSRKVACTRTRVTLPDDLATQLSEALVAANASQSALMYSALVLWFKIPAKRPNYGKTSCWTRR